MCVSVVEEDGPVLLKVCVCVYIFIHLTYKNMYSFIYVTSHSLSFDTFCVYIMFVHKYICTNPYIRGPPNSKQWPSGMFICAVLS